MIDDKFEIGDFIKGFPNETPYTNSRMILGVVVSFKYSNSKWIKIKILEHRDKNLIGRIFERRNNRNLFTLVED